MGKLDEVLEMWESDCVVDSANLQSAMQRTPILHSKYLNFLVRERETYRKSIITLAKLRQLKSRYYTGELTPIELSKLNWKPYQKTKPLKAELERIIDADDDVQATHIAIEISKTFIEAVESIIKEISNRGYLLRTMLDHQKFMAGEG